MIGSFYVAFGPVPLVKPDEAIVYPLLRLKDGTERDADPTFSLAYALAKPGASGSPTATNRNKLLAAALRALGFTRDLLPPAVAAHDGLDFFYLDLAAADTKVIRGIHRSTFVSASFPGIAPVDGKIVVAGPVGGDRLVLDASATTSYPPVPGAAPLPDSGGIAGFRFDVAAAGLDLGTAGGPARPQLALTLVFADTLKSDGRTVTLDLPASARRSFPFAHPAIAATGSDSSTG